MVNYLEIAQLPPHRGSLHPDLVVPVQNDGVANLQSTKKISLAQLAAWLGVQETGQTTNVLDIQPKEGYPGIYVVTYADGSTLEIDVSAGGSSNPGGGGDGKWLPNNTEDPNSTGVGADSSIRVANASHLNVNYNGNIDVSSGGNLEIHNASDVKVYSGSDINVREGSHIDMQATAYLKLRNTSTLNMHESAELEIEYVSIKFLNNFATTSKGDEFSELPEYPTHTGYLVFLQNGLLYGSVLCIGSCPPISINIMKIERDAIGERFRTSTGWKRIDGGDGKYLPNNTTNPESIGVVDSAKVSVRNTSSIDMNDGPSIYMRDSGSLSIVDGANIQMAANASLVGGGGFGALSRLQGKISSGANRITSGARCYLLNTDFDATSELPNSTTIYMSDGDLYYFFTIDSNSYRVRYKIANNGYEEETVTKDNPLVLMIRGLIGNDNKIPIFHKFSASNVEQLRSDLLTLNTLLETETLDRQLADENLQSNINAETQAREEADNAETIARQNDIEDIKSTLDLKVEIGTALDADEDSVRIKTERKNIIDKTVTYEYSVIPTVTQSYAGIMDSAMFRKYNEMESDVANLKSAQFGNPRIAIVSGLGTNPSQSGLTNAFSSALGSPPVAGDRVFASDTNSEWMYSNSEEWSTVTPTQTSLATQSNNGLVKHSTEEGTIGYYIAGVGQLNGYSELKAQVLTLLANQGGGGSRWQQFIQSPIDLDILTALGA